MPRQHFLLVLVLVASIGSACAAGPPVAPTTDAPATSPAVSRYLILDAPTVAHLRQRFNPRDTRPCEIQVVGDSISESHEFLNPLTHDPARPDMAYAAPAHCRLFGQHAVFTDVLQTAASGTTAGWGLNGDGGWGGVRNLRYPFRYQDLDGGRGRVGEREGFPELATILFGTNDLRRYAGDRYSWDKSSAGEREAREKFLGALDEMAQWFLQRGVVPVLVTTPPGDYDAWRLRVAGGPPLGERWVSEIRKLGARRRVPVFDVHRLFIEQGDWRALLRDGVHPNERGYALVNEHFHAAYGDLRRLVLARPGAL